MELVNGLLKPSTAALDAPTTAFIAMPNPWHFALDKWLMDSGASKESGNMMCYGSTGNIQEE